MRQRNREAQSTANDSTFLDEATACFQIASVKKQLVWGLGETPRLLDYAMSFTMAAGFRRVRDRRLALRHYGRRPRARSHRLTGERRTFSAGHGSVVMGVWSLVIPVRGLPPSSLESSMIGRQRYLQLPGDGDDFPPDLCLDRYPRS